MNKTQSYMPDGKLEKCVFFDNLVEQKEYIKEAIATGKWNIVSEIRERQPVETNFFGDTNLENTLIAMDYGLKSYTEYFLDNLDEINSEQDGADGMFMDYEGFAYDMGAVVSGEPECCVNMNQLAPTPVINICVDISFCWNVPAKEIMNRGIAITNLINTLLTKKYIVNLEFVHYNIQSDMNTYLRTKIDTTTISISTIAMLCSPQFFRQISWVSIDECREKNSDCGRGNSILNKKQREMLSKDALFIGGSYNDDNYTDDGGYGTVEKANKHIIELFNDYCRKQNIN